MPYIALSLFYISAVSLRDCFVARFACPFGAALDSLLAMTESYPFLSFPSQFKQKKSGIAILRAMPDDVIIINPRTNSSSGASRTKVLLYPPSRPSRPSRLRHWGDKSPHKERLNIFSYFLPFLLFFLSFFSPYTNKEPTPPKILLS